MKLSEKIKALRSVIDHPIIMDLAKDAEHLEQRWIPVSERLPELPVDPGWSEEVIVATSLGKVFEARYCYPVEGPCYWDSVHQFKGTITHWQPLPAPPSTVTPT